MVDEIRKTVSDQSSIEEKSLKISTPSFRGNFTHQIDDKNRISLPAEFRKVLSDRSEKSVVVTNYISDGARCLEGFGNLAWAEFEKRLREKSRFDPKLHKLENFYLSRSAECPIDSSGRILLPPHLRVYAGLQREVTFTSSIHGFRIWDSRVWEMIFASAEQTLMSKPDTFADVDI